MTRRDRTGDLVDDQPGVVEWHDPRCRAGWLPETTDRRPVPCTVCRPHIGQQQERRRRKRPRTTATDDTRRDAMANIRAAIADAGRRTSGRPNPPEDQR